jgi:hypothetical protein
MSTQQEREITIYATRGGQMKKINTAATTWGELQPLVRNEGFDLSSLLAAENINKSDLVNDLAVLPATAFRLFLRPKQTKSGATPDRKECFAIIKAHIAIFPEDKPKFSIDGKNVTQLPTAIVQDLVAMHCQVTKDPTATTATEVLVETATEVEKTPEVKEVVATLEPISNADLTDEERVEEAIKLISTLDDCEAFEKADKHLNRLLEEVQVTTGSREETEEEAIRREAREMGY